MLRYDLNISGDSDTLELIVPKKYEIDSLSIEKPKAEIPAASMRKGDLRDEEPEPEYYDDDFKHKSLLRCFYDGEPNITTQTRVFVKSEKLMLDDNNQTMSAYHFNQTYYPSAVDREQKFFTIIIDDRVPLKVARVSYTGSLTPPEQAPEGEPYLYITFDGSHMFDVVNDETYNIYLTFKTVTGFKDKKFIVGRNVEEEETDTSEARAEDDDTEEAVTCEVFSQNTVRISKTNLGTDRNDIINALFYEESGYRVSMIENISVERDDFIFNTDGEGFNLYIDKMLSKIQLPLFHTGKTDLHQETAVREKFVDIEREKAINPIVEMEKDVYYPLLVTEDDTYNDVYKIKFNLHFRYHEGDTWTTSTDSMWNGVYKINESDDSPYDLLDYVADGSEAKNEKGYFSYETKENQPDLLSYLGFTDSDVRFQKQTLKKSFLRVSFYDSMNPGKQNLLAYYTVFMDSGNLFSKFARYYEANSYSELKLSDLTNKTELNGIRVDREPYTSTDITVDSQDPEEYRLSSQFVIEDKYNSDASSEGFYLFLWKDNFKGTVEQDIYMKVEFNHAKYGRVIPFMMPYREEKKTVEGVEEIVPAGELKSFGDIVADWQPSTDEDAQVGYDIEKYKDYSYIRMKYRYDKDTNRHVYYLDKEFYGTSDSDSHELILNLYEAKINTNT